MSLLIRRRAQVGAKRPYIRFQAVEGPATVSMNTTGDYPLAVGKGYWFSRDLLHWEPLVPDETIVSIDDGESIFVRGNTHPGKNTTAYRSFAIAGKVNASGDLSSLSDMGRYSAGNSYGTTYCYYGVFKSCTGLLTAPDIEASSALGAYALSSAFEGCTSLVRPAKMRGFVPLHSQSIVIMSDNAMQNIYKNCRSLEALPDISAITTYKNQFCFASAFAGCIKIKVSTTQTDYYNKPYFIPGNYYAAYDSYNGMFTGTGGTFTGTPTGNTTYYTANEVI